MKRTIIFTIAMSISMANLGDVPNGGFFPVETAHGYVSSHDIDKDVKASADGLFKTVVCRNGLSRMPPGNFATPDNAVDDASENVIAVRRSTYAAQGSRTSAQASAHAAPLEPPPSICMLQGRSAPGNLPWQE